MKSSLVVLLLLSLAGNAALAFLALRPAQTPAPAAPVAAAPTGAPAPVIAAPVAAPVAAVAPTPAPASWQALQSGHDLQDLVARMRAGGFPPSVIRATVRQLISDRMDRSAIQRLPFWKQSPGNPEYQAAQAAISAKTREQYEALLGSDALPAASLDPVSRARRYGNLSDEKINQIEAMNRDYGELGSQLYAQRRSGDMQTVMAAQTTMEEDRRKELATLLTPEELEQYELRSSPASSRVSNNLRGVEVSEQEFAALFHAQKAFESADPMRTGQNINSDAMAKRNQAQDTLNEQARGVLGEERFYEYLKSADPAYSRAAQSMAAHPTVTPAQTYELVRLEREYQASTMALGRNATGGNQQTAMATMQALRTEYQNSVNAVVGEEAGKAFVQRNRAGGTTVISTGTVRPSGGP
jgi:hypothetical protein